MILTIYVTLGASLGAQSTWYKLSLHLASGLSIDMKVEELRTAHAFLGSIPGLGRSPGERNGYSLQYSDVGNSMDSTVANSRTRLSDFHTQV